MPSLPQIALRFLAGLLVFNVLYALGARSFGLAYEPGIGVIFSTLPAVYIAYFANQTATKALVLKDWGLIWALCVSILAAVQIILPAILSQQARAAFASPVALQGIVTILAASAAMVAVFLWIGSRIRT